MNKTAMNGNTYTIHLGLLKGRSSNRGTDNKWTRQYDERGNDIEEDYFDTDGQPILCKKGYAKITWKYDARNNVIGHTYFGLNGLPIN